MQSDLDLNTTTEEEIVHQDIILSDTENELKTFDYKGDNPIVTTVKTVKRFGLEVEVIVPATGRPSVMTERVLELLAEAWLVGLNDEEACTFAGIVPKTLYNFQKDKPEFLQWKADLKNNPTIKARFAVYKSLDDPQVALKYLSKKVSDFRDDPTGGASNVTLNVQLNQLVEQDRKRE